MLSPSQKIAALRQRLRLARRPLDPGGAPVLLRVARPSVVLDMMAAFARMRPADLMRRLVVRFDGEEGVDAGGLLKDAMACLWEKLKRDALDVAAGAQFDALLERADSCEGDTLLLPRAPPRDREHRHLLQLEALGRVLFKLCLEGLTSPLPFAPSVYTFLLRGAAASQRAWDHKR